MSAANLTAASVNKLLNPAGERPAKSERKSTKKDTEEPQNAVPASPQKESVPTPPQKEPENPPEVQAAPEGPAPPKKNLGKRFGRNAEGGAAKKQDTKKTECKSAWGKFKRDFQDANPDMDPLLAEIEARKMYVPKNGKQKSLEKIYTEFWKSRNRNWKRLDGVERKKRIRTDFIKSLKPSGCQTCQSMRDSAPPPLAAPLAARSPYY